jgi:hypothetical protein
MRRIGKVFELRDMELHPPFEDDPREEGNRPPPPTEWQPWYCREEE